MSKIQELPVELLLDNLLPKLETKALLNLSCSNKYLLDLGNEDLLWKRKLLDDYNFDGSKTARQSGWKTIYKGLAHPELYMWGQPDNGRLGLDRVEQIAEGVPTPTRLVIGDARIVDLAAGGWSFHALDSLGQVYAWGQLDNGFPLPNEGFEVRDMRANGPVKLQFPDDTQIAKLRCGRSFAVALDQRGNIWTFVAWGIPYRYKISMAHESRIVDIECGWDSACALTVDGEVYFWRPQDGELWSRYRRHVEGRQHEPKIVGVDGTVNCQPWEVTDVDAFNLPPIPSNLPPLKDGGKSGLEAKLVKVAAGWHFLIGLTNGGHVLGMRISGLTGPPDQDRPEWIYMPTFCDVRALQGAGVFEAQGLPDPQGLEVTHISAQFHTFATYSVGEDSLVLMCSRESDSMQPLDQLRPSILPALQNKSVISVHIGDYHYGALTSDGKLFTWGQYSKGALGLGDPRKIPIGEPGGYDNPALANQTHARGIPPPPDVTKPTLVKFGDGDGTRKFCFAAAAAGWHFGALVIDVSEGYTRPEEVNEEEVTVNTRYLISETRERAEQRRRFVQRVPPVNEGQQGHHVLPRLGPFRVGFAGRGAFGGRGG